MTRFILFFTFFKIFLTCSSLAATAVEESPNPTHTVLKHTFTALKRWSVVPDSLKKSFTQKFPAPFALLDALDSFDQITRRIFKESPSISRKASADLVKKEIEEKYSVGSSDDFVFPMITRSITKEELLNVVWSALTSTAYGDILIKANRDGTLKDSIIFYGLFSTSHEDYSYDATISGFMVIKNFFLPTASDAPLSIRPGFMDRALELGAVQQQLLARPGSSRSSTYTSLTDVRSTRTGSLSVTPVELDTYTAASSPSTPDSTHAEAGGGGGEGRAGGSPASFSVDSPRDQRGVVTPKTKRKERGETGSALREPLLNPDGQDSTNYTDPDSAPTNPEKKSCCCTVQ